MSKKSESVSRGDSLDAEMTSLKVAVRVRPLNDKEINLGSKIVVDVHGNDIVITDLKVPEHQGYDHRSRVHKFSFDYGFSSVDPEAVQYASQATVFENFGRVVLQALLEGYNCCVIAYGQSGSGKTYTMMGMKGEEGLTPRICEGLLMKLEDKARQNISFAVNISYMEIYNEQVYDLLQKPDERTNLNKPRLRVREHPIHGPFVEGLSTHVLRSRDNVCQLISEGNDNRIKAATYIHERSSRSHAIFTVHCSQACLDESQPKEVVSKLQLVDLAGSEKAGHEFCQSRLKEGASINKSLVALGNVISALVELSQRFQNSSCKGGKQLFVPYRDSQLTWLMKDSLGGNSHTFMLAAVSPSNECYSETLSTLRYAQRAKNVLSTPIVNEDPATKIIRNLRLEVNKLKGLLINADVLSKKAVIEPLSNISQLNFIMKKSEKKVDHLTRCWFEKWLETYNTMLKKTSFVNEESSAIAKGADVPQREESVAPDPSAESTETTLCEHNTNPDRGTQHGSSMKLKTGDSDTILSDKSSSVSSECIILPNETIFYSKGKRNYGYENYLNKCTSYFKSASLSNVSDTNGGSITPPNNSVKDSSSPVLHSRSLRDMSECRNIFKFPPIVSSLSISAPNVHSSISLQNSSFTSFSLPKGIPELPEFVETTKESEKRSVANFLESADETNSCFEKTCEENRSSRMITPSDNCTKHCSTCEEDADVTSELNSSEFSQHEIRSDTSSNYISAPVHTTFRTQTDNKTLNPNETDGKGCTYDFSSSNSFPDSTDKIHSCREVEFSDIVTKESDDFVKLLNRLQDGSVETISHCFQRKDSEILSLLSLSSNDYPPFNSLDDIFNDGDDMEVSDEACSIEFDALHESTDKCMNEGWNEIHSSSDVSDLSESSDAESEFDYLDFTKSTTGVYSKREISCNSFNATSNEKQNHQNSELLRPISWCKTNLPSVPEDTAVYQTSVNSDASTLHEDEPCHQSVNKYVDVKYDGKSMSSRNETKLECENSAYIAEVSHKLSPLMCRNVHINNFSASGGESKTASSESHTNESVKIPQNMNVENYASYAQKNPVLQRRLCNSDSILKPFPSSEIKHYSKSDNAVYVAPEECSTPLKYSVGNNIKESKTSYENVNNDSIMETLFRNKDSISDLLGFSVQDILDLIGGKSVAQCGAVLKKQSYPLSEERLQCDNIITEEIQKFIDNTEITDANKLADELLKKKLPQCSTAMTSAPTNNDSAFTDYSNHNKLPSKSEVFSPYSDAESMSCTLHDENSGDMLGLSGRDHSKIEKLNVEKRVSETEKSSSDTPKAHVTETDKMKDTEEIKVKAFNNIEGNGRLKYEKLNVAVKEIHCEKENALEYFTLNGCQEILPGPLSDESDCLDNDADSINTTIKQFAQPQQISSSNSKSTTKEVTSPYSAEADTIPFRSDLQNFLTESSDDDVTDGNSQAKPFTEYSTFGNLNITGLAPIQEETIDEDDDVISEPSEDDSPNISFQFDSLERPKNGSVVKKEPAYIEQFYKTDDITDGKECTEELQKSENLSNMLNDISKTFYNKNYDLLVKDCIETEKREQNKKLLDLNFNHTKCVEILKETVDPEDMLKLSSTPNFKENLINSAADTCELVVEYQDSEKSLSSFTRENYDKCNIICERINQNVESPEDNIKMNNSKEINSLQDQICSWDSLSSSTSSDSITFVFVGKENKDIIMSETNSRSFQSSLFSSVSLDSLEKSSVHQNQVACASPRTLSIDSLVAEELLFQLRNSDPVQPLASEIKQDAGYKYEVNNILTDKKQAPQKTNFAATSQLNSNQHLKMYHHMHCNVKDDISQEAATESLGTEISEKQNAVSNTVRNQILSYHSNTFPSESCHRDDNKFQNLREKYSCISPESNGDVEDQTSNFINSRDNSKELHVVENVCHSFSNDSNKENLTDIHVCEMQKHIPEENIFSTSSHFGSADFDNHYDLDLQSNHSNVALNNCDVTSFHRSLELVAVDNYDAPKLADLPDMYSKNNSFCNKCVTNDNNELVPVKELTEQNLKIFNSEFEENQEENFILPPPSTFGGSEDNGLSVISNCSSLSLDNNHSKTSVDVFSKSTQTDQNVKNECIKTRENNAMMESRNTDLIERMMDLMAETLKLMKEQYSRTPKGSHSHTRRKLNFSSDSDKNMSDLQQKTLTPPTLSKHRKYLSKERSADSKVMKYIQSILPPDNESDYSIDNISHPVANSEVLPYPPKNANEKHMSKRSKINHGDQRSAMGKKPNFYTLPFDFITCKYQCKKPPNALKLKKTDNGSQTSVNYLLGKTKNLNFASNECNNLSALKSLNGKECKTTDINEMAGLKQSLPNPGSSKNHLKHLIELRRQVVQATMGSSNVSEKLNCESQVTDPLKSSSSSSEGYLSSVSSRGPFRHLSEASTDSQEFTCTAGHSLQKQCFPKHSVKPLEFRTQFDEDVAVSPDSRWLNTSADSGAFFLDSPGTEKKANLDEFPPPPPSTCIGATSSAVCTSPKRTETRSLLQHNDTLRTSPNPQEAKVPSFSKTKWDEIKNERRKRDKTDFALGFQELDEIGENYLDILLRKNVSVHSSTSSDLSFCTGKPVKNRSPKSSRTSRNSPRLKHVSSQEIQRLLESIEKDRRLLQQIQHNHVFDKKYSPSPVLPSCSSLEIIDDLFYQDTYKSLPGHYGCLNSSASNEV